MGNNSQQGRCIVSNNILNGYGRLKWCFREKPINEMGNGWRFLSEIDTGEFLRDVDNLSMCDYNTIINIEPAVMEIYDMPYGTDITLIEEDGERFFIYSETGDIVRPIH